MNRSSAPAARPAVSATHSGEYSHSGVQEVAARRSSRWWLNTAIGSRWPSSSSSSRSFMSAGPSTRTYAGRSSSIVCATNRAQAGEW